MKFRSEQLRKPEFLQPPPEPLVPPRQAARPQEQLLFPSKFQLRGAKIDKARFLLHARFLPYPGRFLAFFASGG